MAEYEKQTKKLGRPKAVKSAEDVEVNEKDSKILAMEKKGKITIEDITAKWNAVFGEMSQMNGTKGIGTVADKWNKLNPFLQNQRIKDLYSRAKSYSKVKIGEFLADPANHEQELRSLGWANSANQQIYYNVLRRACDIPLYNYYKIPSAEANYKSTEFKFEDRLTDEWLEKFNIPNTFKTIAMEVKREGKSSYLFRNKFEGENQSKKVSYCAFQKMPSEWIKITGKGQLGFTISFNMMYFTNPANSPSDFGDFMVKAWQDLTNQKIIEKKTDPKTKVESYELNEDSARNYSFTYNDTKYGTAIESVINKAGTTYMFWLRLPYDMCFTFGSDNSHPWVAPDTMGLMLKLQELTDYGQLAGLIASTPLTAVLTGEIEPIEHAKAGKNESIFNPEVLKGYMQQFNSATSTNVEAWMWPAKNIKLQQLSSDVNSSEIISTATENFVESAGEAGLTITTSKPNVSQVHTAQDLAASQQRYVTLQFENVLNFILAHKLGLTNLWKIRLWGDCFSIADEKKYLKEIVAGGNIAMLPKLMSAEGMSVRDTKAVSEYIKSLDFYKDFMTYTQISQSKLQEEQTRRAKELDIEQSEGNGEETKKVGRPSKDEGSVDNEATAASKDAGTNTSDNRE